MSNVRFSSTQVPVSRGGNRFGMIARALVTGWMLFAAIAMQGASQFIAVGESGTMLASADGQSWSPVNCGTTRRLRGVASMGSTIVAVGEAGTILSSTDGIGWTPQTSNVPQSLRGVAASSTAFVAVGGDSGALIFTSSDGANWIFSYPTGGSLRAVAWGNNEFVAVGATGTILTSSNGGTWTTQASGTTDRIDGVVWTGAKFVALTATGVVLTSADGIVWASNQANPPAWIEGFAWSASRLVAVGADGRISVSTDGLAWTTVTSQTVATLHGIVWTGASSALDGDPVALLGNIDFRLLSAPIAQTISVGASAILNAVASIPNATYQWFKNAAPLTNATTGTLTISNAQASDAGLYSVSISNGSATVTSTSAKLSLRGYGSTGSQFAAVGDGGAILTSGDGVSWTPRTSGATRRLRGVAANADTLVTVGEQGIVLTSADGNIWTLRSSGTTETLRGVAFGTSRFVAVGGASSALVLTSIDGATWMQATVPSAATLRGVAWGRDLFVAVGQSGVLLTSGDGLTWTAQTSGISDRIDGVAWTGTQFEAITESGGLLTSTDGVSWNAASFSPAPWIEAMTWSDKRYVVVGADGQTASSRDGLFWAVASPSSHATLHGVTWTGSIVRATADLAAGLSALAQVPTITSTPLGAMVGTGGSATFSVTAAGATGYQWQLNGVPFSESPNYAGAGTVTLTISNIQPALSGTYAVVVSNAFGSTMVTVPLVLRGQGSMGQQFVAVGDNGTILTSPDAATWTPEVSSFGGRLRGVTAGSNTYVAVGESGAILTSPNGASWSCQSSGITETLRAVTAGPNGFVAVGGDSAAKILVSGDGVTWSAVTAVANGTLRGVVYGGSGFVAVGTHGTILASRDGAAWTSQASGSSDRIDGIVWTGTRYEAATATGELLTSSDGVTWASSSISPPSWIEALTWSDTRYVVVGGDGQIASTTDGQSWAAIAPTHGVTLHGVTWSGGSAATTIDISAALSDLAQVPTITTGPISALVGAGGSARFSVIASGATSYQWFLNDAPLANNATYSGATTATLSVSNSQSGTDGVYSVQVGNASGSMSASATLSFRGQGTMGQKFVAVGDAGILLTSSNGADWISQVSHTTRRLRGVTAGNSEYVVVGEAGTILTSLDGVVWTTQSSNCTETLRGVAAAPGRFVAVGGDSAAKIFTSKDAITWSQATVNVSDTLRGVAYGPAGFVAVGKHGTILTSLDGQSWTAQSSDTTDRIEGVVWTGHQYTAITQYGSLLTSVDGATWNTAPADLAAWVEGIAWNTSQYVIVGENGQIATSPDGTYWTAAAPVTNATLHGVAWSAGAFVPHDDPVALLGNAAQTPFVSMAPSSTIVAAGESTSLAATATGADLSYQWYKNGVPVAGATSSSLGFAPVTGRDGGVYTLIVRNAAGMAQTAPVLLTIPPTYTFSTLAGTANASGSTDGVGAAARFEQPHGVVVNADGTLFVTDSPANTIRAIGPDATVTTVAGVADAMGSSDGTGSVARFFWPSGIAVARSGTLYVTDQSNSTVRKITTAFEVTTLAGAVNMPGAVNGTGSSARFNQPSSLAVDSAENVYVADYASHTVRRITPSGAVSTLAGQIGDGGFVDGPFAQARFNGPTSITCDVADNLYAVDANGIRVISNSGVVRTLRSPSGSPVTYGRIGVAVDDTGNLFTIESDNTVHLVTKVGTSMVIAGQTSSSGSSDGVGTNALFNWPRGIAVDRSGNLYIADSFNETIRLGTPSFVLPSIDAQPADQTVADGSTLTLSVGASGTGPFTYQWLKAGVVLSGATDSMLQISAVQPSDAGSYSVVVTGAGGTINSASATVTVSTTAPSFSAQPSSLTLQTGQSSSLSVTVTGAPPPTLQWRFNGNAIAGATSATLSLSNVTTANSGRYDVVATNVAGAVTSDVATVTVAAPPPPPPAPPPVVVNVAPSITAQPTGAATVVGQTVSFTVTATGTPSPTFQWRKGTEAISGATSATLNLGAVTLADAGDYSVVVSNVAGSLTSNIATLVVDQPAAIAQQPSSITVAPHGSAVLTVSASGTPTPTYQWFKNGVALVAATGATLNLTDLSLGDGGDYRVIVTNRDTSVTSNVATVVVSSPPMITVEPVPQIALPGTDATFSVTAVGASTYQWQKNGVAIPGATLTTLTLTNVQSADAASYDVEVTNGFGTTASSPASLTLSLVAVAPVITVEPESRTRILVGGSATFSVTATGVPAPTYQWRKDGTAIAGATTATFQIVAANGDDAGIYDVVVGNAAGTVTSDPAVLTVSHHSYAGVYFGFFAGGGAFAIYIRADNTGVLLGYLPGSTTPYLNLAVAIDDDGNFLITEDSLASIPITNHLVPRIAAAASPLVITGAIGLDGSVTGTVSGSSTSTLSATRAADNGPTQASAGYYTAGVHGASSSTFTILSATGQAFVLTQSSTGSDAGSGIVTANGQIAVTTASGEIISATVANAVLSETVTDAHGGQTTFSGATEEITATQRLINISSRAYAGSGDGTAIAGFVISGNEAKPVLIRAIGPSLAQFGVGNVLSAPRLQLYHDGKLVAENSGWSAGVDADEIAAVAARANAFPLPSLSDDAAIYTSLAPGAYTALLSSSNGASGNALIEVYDLSAAALGQKLINISTRAVAGSGDESLIAGLVIAGTVPKRVLIRAVGPALAQFGVRNVAPQPELVLYHGGQVVAQNKGWSSSPDAVGIATAAHDVGAFALPTGSSDSALILSLAPGAYSAKVISAMPGIALIEVYELP
jgi:hypothetical protein